MKAESPLEKTEGLEWVREQEKTQEARGEDQGSGMENLSKRVEAEKREVGLLEANLQSPLIE